MPMKSPYISSGSPEIPQSRVVTRTCAYSNFNSTWITKSFRIDTAERTGPEIPQSQVVTRTWAYSNFNSTWITKSIRIDAAERTGLIPFETVSEWAKVGFIPFETVKIAQPTCTPDQEHRAKEVTRTCTYSNFNRFIPFETVSEWAKVVPEVF
ncbi:hypothetical protein TREMEDRAFT_66437 [Tremella mesenterica DSM 1558]|uniref:uncharacterized protein n=1 Tax=Tremella mesenterica (strain ATCC 24925 / CBS 8224 / DSM 1558 / NBRC 9311 / NRRL Y-6157 / RJB 2259-6 / UBC 559-6) TaxID=578456 RepID=UPI00032D1787|nr:uncharacterized protein TREMEDRAFT_66437 [Tremella mesenterica DSM 1558]EIW65527.1 hypothetical protein TREMEDRAFT_66437 [Tremella mesenterica DSM 1558]